jgi:hypothetical protein
LILFLHTISRAGIAIKNLRMVVLVFTKFKGRVDGELFSGASLAGKELLNF